MLRLLAPETQQAASLHIVRLPGIESGTFHLRENSVSSMISGTFAAGFEHSRINVRGSAGSGSLKRLIEEGLEAAVRMKTIQGPAIFLAQFAGDAAPFNNLENIAGWAAGLGYKGVQIPSWDGRLFDLKRAVGEQNIL